MSVVDALNDAVACPYVETPGRPHGDAASVRARLFSDWYHGDHKIARAIAVDALTTHQIPSGEARRSDARSLVVTAPRRGDRERRHRPSNDGTHTTHTKCVPSVRLVDTEARAVPLRPATRGDLHRQPRRGERSAERPSGLPRRFREPRTEEAFVGRTSAFSSTEQGSGRLPVLTLLSLVNMDLLVSFPRKPRPNG